MAWSNGLIEEKILEAKHGLKIDYMPTRNQLNAFYGDTRLSNKVNKTLGYYGWAEKLGLPVQRNDTYTGKEAERWATEYLSANGFSSVQMPQNHPYDLLVDGRVKVDVKISHLYHTKKGFSFYSFALRKRFPTCDVYFLIAVDDSGERVVYTVPAHHAKQTQISIGKTTSVYDKYRHNLRYISMLSDALGTSDCANSTALGGKS